MEIIVQIIPFPSPKCKQQNGKPFSIASIIIIIIVVIIIIITIIALKILADTFRGYGIIMTVTAIMGLFYRWQPRQIKPFISPIFPHF